MFTVHHGVTGECFGQPFAEQTAAEEAARKRSLKMRYTLTIRNDGKDVSVAYKGAVEALPVESEDA